MLGEIKAVGFNWCPYGYAYANGALIQIQQNAALYALLSTFFGGDGRVTFGLPNLQSRVGVGIYTGGGGDPFMPYQIGNFGGAESTQLSLSQLPAHTHNATTTVQASTSVAVNSSGLGATTTINALTAPTSRSPSPSGNLPTAGSVVISGSPTTVQNYAAPGNGTAATMAPGMATSAITGSVTANASTTASASTTVDPMGASAAVDLRVPFLALNYIIATQGVFPQRN